MSKVKSKTLLIMVSLVLIVVIVGVSYAIWQITLQQESTNIVSGSSESFRK